MKLTLSAGGGVTGLSKENTVDIDSLDKNTVASLMEYINSSDHKIPMNFSESWCLNDGKEVPINKDKMNDKLKQLYDSMKKGLNYPG